MILKDILHLKPSEQAAVIFDNGVHSDVISYKKFLYEAQHVLAEFKSKISSDPSIVGILCPQCVYTPLLVYTCFIANYVFLPLSQDSNSWITILKKCNVRYVFVHQSILLQILGVLKSVIESTAPISSLGGLYTVLVIKLDATILTSSSFTYIIQSSGTTGTSKTILVPEQSFVPNLIDLLNILNIQQSDVIFVSSALTFDASIIQIFLGLCSSATLLLVSEQLRRHPENIAKCLEKHAVSVLQCTPSFLTLIGEHFQAKHLFCNGSKLKALVLGGESFPPKEKCVKWKEALPQLRLFNLYGTSEVSAWASIYEVNSDDFCIEGKKFESDWVPIGKPLSKTVIEVQNSSGEVIKHGLGNIWIGSKERVCKIEDSTMSTDESTNDKCVMRATGDLGFQDGEEIFFSGRCDDRIKRNGIFISTIQVNNVVRNIPGVKESFSTVDKEMNNILIVYYVPENHGVEINVFEFMLKSYPSEFIPDKIAAVDCFPLTKHGKIDKKKLRKKISKEVLDWDASYVKAIVTKCWNEVLRISPENFISNELEFSVLGGNSFIAAYLVNKLSDFFPQKISYEEMFVKVLTSSLNQFIEFITFYVGVAVETKLEVDTSSFSNFKRQRCNHFNALLKTHISQTCMCSRYFSDFYRIYFSNLPNNLLFSQQWYFDMQKCVDASPLLVFYENSPDGVVYIGSHSHIFVALSLKNGSLLWRQVLSDRIESSAIVSPDGRFICVGCYDGFIYALDHATGMIHWKYKTNDIVKCSPALCKKHALIIVGSYDKHIYALDVTVKVCKWKLKCNSSCFATPLVMEEQNCVVVALLCGSLCSISIQTGQKVWEINFSGKPLFSSPCLCKNFILVGCVDGFLYAVDFNGIQLWSYETKAPIFSSPVAIYEYEELLFIGGNDQILYCLNEHGFLLWKYKTNCPIFSSISVLHASSLQNSSLQLEINVVVVVISTNGEVCALKCKYFPSQSDLYMKSTSDIRKNNKSIAHEKVSLNDNEIVSVGDVSSVIEVSCIGLYKFSGEIFSSPVVCNMKMVVGCRDNNIYCMNICDLYEHV